MKQRDHVDVVELDAVRGNRVREGSERRGHARRIADQSRFGFGSAALRKHARRVAALGLAARDRNAQVIEQQPFNRNPRRI
jgi:hypothetical protein